jgi:hypothetical protein
MFTPSYRDIIRKYEKSKKVENKNDEQPKFTYNISLPEIPQISTLLYKKANSKLHIEVNYEQLPYTPSFFQEVFEWLNLVSENIDTKYLSSYYIAKTYFSELTTKETVYFSYVHSNEFFRGFQTAEFRWAGTDAPKTVNKKIEEGLDYRFVTYLQGISRSGDLSKYQVVNSIVNYINASTLFIEVWCFTEYKTISELYLSSMICLKSYLSGKQSVVFCLPPKHKFTHQIIEFITFVSGFYEVTNLVCAYWDYDVCTWLVLKNRSANLSISTYTTILKYCESLKETPELPLFQSAEFSKYPFVNIINTTLESIDYSADFESVAEYNEYIINYLGLAK